MSDFETNKTHYNENELADLLDALIPPENQQATAPDPLATPDSHDPALDMALRLASMPSAIPSSLMMARIQAQMLAANQVKHPPGQYVTRIITLFARTAAAAVTVIFVMSALSSLMDYAVPGDLLYPAKRAFENSQIVFAEGAYDVAETRLVHARERIAEAERLLNRGEVDLALIEQINRDIQVAQVLAFDEGVNDHLNSVQSSLYRLIARANASSDSVIQTAYGYNKFYSILSLSNNTQAGKSTKNARDIIAVDTSLLFFSAHDTPDTTGDSLTNVIFEVPVKAIKGNTISLTSSDLRVRDDDPLLDVIQVGDFLRLDGQIHTTDGQQTLVNVNEFALMDAQGERIALELNAERLEAWRDNGTCENPPPPWAWATNWRIRCRHITASIR